MKDKEKIRRLGRFALVVVVWIITLTIQSVGFAGGTVKHHQITSKILADVGEVANRELSVYLPEEYETLRPLYPAVYLLHGATGTNRLFLGQGYLGIK